MQVVLPQLFTVIRFCCFPTIKRDPFYQELLAVTTTLFLYGFTLLVSGSVPPSCPGPPPLALRSHSLVLSRSPWVALCSLIARLPPPEPRGQAKQPGAKEPRGQRAKQSSQGTKGPRSQGAKEPNVFPEILLARRQVFASLRPLRDGSSRPKRSLLGEREARLAPPPSTPSHVRGEEE